MSRWKDFIDAIRGDDEDEKKRAREKEVEHHTNNFFDRIADKVTDTAGDVVHGVEQGVDKAEEGVKDYFAPDPDKVRVRDVLREFPAALVSDKNAPKEFIEDTLQSIPRGAAGLGISAYDKARGVEPGTDNPTWQPSSPFLKALLGGEGDEKVITAQERNANYKKDLEGAGVNSRLAGAGAFAGAGVMSALDAPTGLGSIAKSFGKKGIKQLAKEGGEDAVEQLIRGRAPSLAEDIIKDIVPKIAKATDEKTVRETLEGAQRGLTGKIDEAPTLIQKAKDKVAELVPKGPNPGPGADATLDDGVDGAAARFRARMKTTEESAKDIPKRNTWDRIADSLFDRNKALSDFGNEYKNRTGEALSVDEDPHALAQLMNGMNDKVLEDTRNLVGVLKKSGDIDAVKTLGVARQVSEDRAGLYGDDFVQEARSAVEDLQHKLTPDQFNRVDSVVKAVNGFQSSQLDRLHQAGIVSDEALQGIKEANPNYFSKFNLLEYINDNKDLFGSSNSKNVRDNVIKAAKGLGDDASRRFQILDPVESVMKGAFATEKAIQNNGIFHSIRNLQESLPDMIHVVRDAGDVAQRMDLSLENKELRPVAKKVEGMIGTRSKAVSKLQTQINNLEKRGLQASLKDGGASPIPNFIPKALGGEVPTGQTGRTLASDFIGDAAGAVDRNVARQIDRLSKLRDTNLAKANKLLGEQADDASQLLAVKGNEAGVAAARTAHNAQQKINKIRGAGKTGADNATTGSDLGSQDTGRFIRSLVEGPVAEVQRLKKMVGTRDKNSAKLLDDIESLSNEYSGIAGTIKTNADEAQALKDRAVPEGFDLIHGMRDGIRETLAVPKDIARVYTGKNDVQRGQLDKIFNSIGNVSKQSYTTLSLPFTLVKNPIRDARQAAFTSQYIPKKDTATILPYAARWVRGLIDGLTDSPLAREVAQNGGGGAGIYNDARTAEQITKDIQRSVAGPTVNTRADFAREAARIIGTPVRLPVKGLQSLGRAIEYAPRLAEAKAAKDAGESAKTAALAARNVTVDFQNGGTLSRVLNNYLTFFNTRVQGNYNVAKSIKRDPQRAGIALAANVITPSVMGYAWNMTQFPEVMDQISQDDRDNNFILVLGDNQDDAGNFTQVIKIPKNDPDKIFGNVVENVMRGIYHEDPKSFKQMAMETLGNTLPINAVKDGAVNNSRVLSNLPPILRTPIEAATNHNLYFDSPIVPESLQDLPADEQVRDNTPEIDKFTGALTGSSPLVAGNTRKGLTGNLLSEDPASQLGGSVTGASGSKPTNQFYSTLGKTTKNRASASKHINEAIAAGNYEEAQRTADTYNAYLKTTFTPFAESYGKYMTQDLADVYDSQKIVLSTRSIKQRRRNALEKAASSK